MLQSTLIKVGIHLEGSFGTSENAPADSTQQTDCPTNFEQYAGERLGFIVDYGADGWSQGSPNYAGKLVAAAKPLIDHPPHVLMLVPLFVKTLFLPLYPPNSTPPPSPPSPFSGDYFVPGSPVEGFVTRWTDGDSTVTYDNKGLISGSNQIDADSIEIMSDGSGTSGGERRRHKLRPSNILT